MIIEIDIENEDMEFYLFDGVEVFHIDESDKFNKNCFIYPMEMKMA